MKDFPMEAYGWLPGGADDPDRWICKDGRTLLPSQMDTQHLKHTIALIERVQKAGRYWAINPKFRHSTPEGAREWLERLTCELKTR